MGVEVDDLCSLSISQEDFNKLSNWAKDIYNIAVVIDYFCKTQPEIEELYNLTPVVTYLRHEVNLLHAFFINNTI